ncbi:MAG: tetratricopeptide repeat protein [Chromatiales bacterium]
MGRHISGLPALLFFAWTVSSSGEEPRAIASAGGIVSAHGDEQIRPADRDRWHRIDAGQSVSAGDTLRTGPYGALSVLFRDETQIRIHRNSVFEIEDVRSGDAVGPSRFRLLSGSVWSRAKALLRSVAAQVTPQQRVIEIGTPTATIGIRGTDWHVSVEPGRSALTVLSGQGEMFNEFGSVTVTGGELGVAEAGRAPSKRVIVDLRDRPLIVVETSLAWIDTLSITGRPSGEIKRELERLMASAAAGDVATRLARAEAAYDLGEYAVVRDEVKAIQQGAPASGEARGRLQLLQGMLKLRERDYGMANRLLQQAYPQLGGRAQVIAQLGQAGVLIEEDKFKQAEGLLDRLAAQQGQYPEVHLMRIWLTSFSGAQQQAIALALEGERRFPTDARFPALLAHLYFLTDQRSEMKAAFERALSMDPTQLHAWHWKGLYYHFVEPDPGEAVAAYKNTLAISPNSSATWNNLGLVYFDLGDYTEAERAMQEAIRADPGSALAKANYGYILAFLDRLDEAEKLFRQAERLRADEPYGLLGIGYLDLYRGYPDRAIESFLKAGTVDPELPGVNRSLAAAYYQAGRFEDAKQELETARRFDPDDPVPDVIGSIFAVDHFEAGEAVRLAREGFQKTLRTESFAVENLANAKSGSATLGNAYSNLGLFEWGGYYTLLAFDPYLANGYFYLSQNNQFASEEARLGANRQGLLLDPTAVSFPTRYYEPFRQPRHDVTLFGSVGDNGGASNYTAFGSVQGFMRTPNPVAYFVSGSRTDDDGFRDNADFTNESALVGVGTTLNSRKQNLLFVLDAQRFNNGTRQTDNDLDDKFTDEFILMSLGYQHRINFHNRIMVRLFGGIEHDETRTFNEGQFPIDTAFACPPPDFICNSVLDNESRLFQFQLRHLLDIGPVQFTWGAEWFTGRTDTATDTDLFGPAGYSFFTELSSQDIDADVLYVQGRWKVNRDLWFDAGLFKRHLRLEIVDPDFFGTVFISELDEDQLDPRLGVAWRVTQNHWLRVAAQRKLLFPQRAAETLAPVDTVGIVVPDRFFTFFTGGPSAEDLQLRWDAEWLPWLFTFAGAEHLELDDFQIGSVFHKEGEIELATVGTNIWFLERFGLRAAYQRLWSENRSGDAFDGLDLLGVPEEFFDVLLTWVHPRHVRTELFVDYVGQRWNDNANTDRLDGYWTTGFRVNWQPMRKHWSLTLQVNDLFDEQPEFFRNFPDPGRSVFLSAEYRFGEDPAEADAGTTTWPAFSTADTQSSVAAGAGHSTVATHVSETSTATSVKRRRVEFGLDLSGGYREDALDWNTAFDITGTVTPNVFEERSWENLQISLFHAEAFAVFGPGLYLTGSFAYGGIQDGENRDSFFLSDNRTDEFFRVVAETSDEDVEDESIGVGYRFQIYNSKAGSAHLIPLVGYSRHEQNLEDTDGVQVIDTFGGFSGPFRGLRDTYQTEWEGPWVGLRTGVGLRQNLELFATGEYHWADYEAEANVNRNAVLAHPRSFEHEADGRGWVVSVGVDWYPEVLNKARADRDGKGRWYVRLRGDWQDWEADDGTERLFFADGTTFESRLNEVNWDSWSVNLGLGFRY